MKKLSVLLLVVLISSFVAASGFYTAPRLPGKIAIDGKLDEWTNVPSINLDSAEYLVATNRSWGGVKDISGKIYVMWDEDYLYIACDITDNVVIQEKTGGHIFQGDAIEIYLRMNYYEDGGKSHYTSTDYQFGFTPGTDAKAPAWHLWNNSAMIEDILIAAQKTATGYQLEVAIPIWEMGLELEESLEIGFDVAIDDVDSKGAADTELQLCWSRSADGWQNPTVFQVVMLGRKK